MNLDLLLALALLTAPTPPANVQTYQPLAPVIQNVAVQLQVMDARERNWLLGRSVDFADDLKILRRRVVDYADAPPLSDADLLPDHETTKDCYSFNLLYARHLEERSTLTTWHREWFADTLAETMQLRRVWDYASDARCEYYYVTCRREALKRLREEVGAENYYAGRWPPCVPLWRFDR